jgi:hypothetical protein
MLDRSKSSHSSMRISAIVFLLNRSLRTRWRRYIGLSIGVAIGTFALCTTFGFGIGAARSLATHFDRMFPPQRVILRPKAINAVWLKFQAAPITPVTVRTVRAMLGVLRVSPEATIRFPICGEGELFGSTFQTDLTVTGVEPWLFGADAPPMYTYDPAHPPREVPAILSQYFLDLYNMTLAESNGLPKLAPAAVIGRHLRLILGSSSIRPVDPGSSAAANVEVLDTRLVGLSSNPELLGLMIPLEAVEAFNARHGVSGRTYQAIHAELAKPDALDSQKAKLATLGLEVHESGAAWRRALTIARLAAGGFVGIGALVFFMALAYLSASISRLLERRRREIALWRALGARNRGIIGLFGAEAGLCLLPGVIAACAATTGLMRYANHWYAAWRGEQTYLPEILLDVPGWSICAVAGICWVAMIAIAMARAYFVARKSIVDEILRTS